MFNIKYYINKYNIDITKNIPPDYIVELNSSELIVILDKIIKAQQKQKIGNKTKIGCNLK